MASSRFPRLRRLAKRGQHFLARFTRSKEEARVLPRVESALNPETGEGRERVDRLARIRLAVAEKRLHRISNLNLVRESGKLFSFDLDAWLSNRKPGLVATEIGGGVGRALLDLQQSGKFARLYNLDLVPGEAKGVIPLAGDALAAPIPKSDFIMSQLVLESVGFPEHMIPRVTRALKRGGRALLYLSSYTGSPGDDYAKSIKTRLLDYRPLVSAIERGTLRVRRARLRVRLLGEGLKRLWLPRPFKARALREDDLIVYIEKD